MSWANFTSRGRRETAVGRHSGPISPRQSSQLYHLTSSVSITCASGRQCLAPGTMGPLRPLTETVGHSARRRLGYRSRDFGYSLSVFAIDQQLKLATSPEIHCHNGFTSWFDPAAGRCYWAKKRSPSLLRIGGVWSVGVGYPGDTATGTGAPRSRPGAPRCRSRTGHRAMRRVRTAGPIRPWHAADCGVARGRETRPPRDATYRVTGPPRIRMRQPRRAPGPGGRPAWCRPPARSSCSSDRWRRP